MAQETRYLSFTQVSGTASVSCSGPPLATLPQPTMECRFTAMPALGQTFVIETVLENANAAPFARPQLDTPFATAAITSLAPVAGTRDATVRIQGTVTWTPADPLGDVMLTLYAPNPLLRGLASSQAAQWFDYAEWARFVYYARCADVTTTPGCITVTERNGTVRFARAALVFPGRAVMKAGPAAQSRPSSSAADYFEEDHAALPLTAFKRAPRSPLFNDRVALVP